MKELLLPLQAELKERVKRKKKGYKLVANSTSGSSGA